jgi:hypothetical protein
MLECWNAGMLECWNAGMLECWNAGMLERRDATVRRYMLTCEYANVPLVEDSYNSFREKNIEIGRTNVGYPIDTENVVLIGVAA